MMALFVYFWWVQSAALVGVKGWLLISIGVVADSGVSGGFVLHSGQKSC